MSGTPNTITPRQFAVALIHHEIQGVRDRIDAHVAHRNHPDLFNDQIRVFLERTAELLKSAAQALQDSQNDDP